MLVILYNLWANHAVKGEDGRIAYVGHKKLDWQRDFGRTRVNSTPFALLFVLVPSLEFV